MRTWSATTQYRATHEDDPIVAVEGELGEIWGDVAQRKRITWPLIVIAGRVAP
jgi:hypothetical protein